MVGTNITPCFTDKENEVKEAYVIVQRCTVAVVKSGSNPEIVTPNFVIQTIILSWSTTCQQRGWQRWRDHCSRDQNK